MIHVAPILAVLILGCAPAMTMADDSIEGLPEVIESPSGNYRLVLRPWLTNKEAWFGPCLLSASGDTVHAYRIAGGFESSAFCVSDSGHVGFIRLLRRESSHRYFAFDGILDVSVYDLQENPGTSWQYYFPMTRDGDDWERILKAYALSSEGDLCLAIYDSDELSYLVYGIPFGEDRHWRVTLRWKPDHITFQDAGIEVTGRARDGTLRRRLLDACGRTVEGP